MLETKLCRKCNTIKNFSEFYKNKKTNDGVQYICIPCNKKRVKIWKSKNREHLKISKIEWSRSMRGLVFNLYSDQKNNSISRGHNHPDYSRDELIEWVYSQPLFNNLFDKWVDSGYSTELRPSLDRRDESIGYSFNNIVLMTWGDNMEKGRVSHIGGDYDCMAISQYDMSRNLIASFVSQTDAARKTGYSQAGISRCINGITAKYKNCLWEKSN